MIRSRTALEGTRFGRLLVLREVDTPIGEKRRYLCRCECGKESVVNRYSLLSGKTRSCGCLRYNTGVPSPSGTERKERQGDTRFEGMPVREIAARLGISRQAFYDRLDKGWPLEEALLTPKQAVRHRHAASSDNAFFADELAQKLGLTKDAIYYRIRQGWSLYDICNTPKYKRRTKEASHD